MGRSKQISDNSVLDIVRTAFTESGFGTSSRELARATGLSQATLIQRFGSKESLFLAAMLPTPLDPNLLNLHCDDFTALVNCTVEQIFARVPIALQAALSDIPNRDMMNEIHETLGVPAFVASLTGHVGALGAAGKFHNGTNPSALVEAILVAAHGFTLIALTSPNRQLPRDAIVRFAKTLAGSNMETAQ